jgi:branched chain amino acid efflux pump
MMSPRSEFLLGLKALTPVLFGVIPFAMISGIAAVGAGIPPGTALAMSFIVFAGSAQLVASQLIGVNAPVFVIILSAIIVNLRFMMYSASLAPYLKPLPRKWKWLLSYLLTDQAYAVTITRLNRGTNPTNGHWFFLGAAFTMWGTWQISTALGIFLGAQVPASWSLDFTVALTFLALAVPAIKDYATMTAALVAGITAMIVVALPFKLGLVSASLVGIFAGLVAESNRP